MIETLFVLFLYMGGNPTEWTPTFSLKECLSIKRSIERNVGKKVGERYSCQKKTVEIRKRDDDRYEIVKFIEE